MERKKRGEKKPKSFGLHFSEGQIGVCGAHETLGGGRDKESIGFRERRGKRAAYRVYYNGAKRQGEQG